MILSKSICVFNRPVEYKEAVKPASKLYYNQLRALQTECNAITFRSKVKRTNVLEKNLINVHQNHTNKQIIINVYIYIILHAYLCLVFHKNKFMRIK